MIVLTILLILVTGYAVVASVILVKFSKRLLEFDDIFQLFADDIDTNIRFFKKLNNTPMMENSPEIISAHNNMKIIKTRLEEFTTRFEELTGQKLRKEDKPR